jgi:hypothetical protein
MARSVFVDTSAWYALINRRDALHTRTRTALKTLTHQRARLVTTDYVIDESCTLTKLRAGAEAASRLLQLLDETAMVSWEWIGADRFSRAKALFVSQRDQGYSFTDCTSFVVMREGRIDEALTSDHRFAVAGFRPLLKMG